MILHLEATEAGTIVPALYTRKLRSKRLSKCPKVTLSINGRRRCLHTLCCLSKDSTLPSSTWIVGAVRGIQPPPRVGEVSVGGEKQRQQLWCFSQRNATQNLTIRSSKPSTAAGLVPNSEACPCMEENGKLKAYEVFLLQECRTWSDYTVKFTWQLSSEIAAN